MKKPKSITLGAKNSILPWILLSLVLAAAVYQGYHPPVSDEYPADFSIFRTAAELIRLGLGAQLYDLGVQKEAFSRIVGPPYSQFLVYNHPPAEALIYFPFAFVEFQTGLRFMRAFNSILLSAMIVWSAYRIRFWTNGLLFMVFLWMISLRPLSGMISTGQDSLWIVLLTVAGLAALVEHRHVHAALFLGLASLKFTILLPLWVILCFLGFYAVVIDALLVGALLWLLPVILFGPVVVTSYIGLCLALIGVEGQWGIHSALLWNFRGLILQFIADPRKAFFLSIPPGVACAFLTKLLPQCYRIPAALMIATFFSPHVYQHDALMYSGSFILLIWNYERFGSERTLGGAALQDSG